MVCLHAFPRYLLLESSSVLLECLVFLFFFCIILSSLDIFFFIPSFVNIFWFISLGSIVCFTCIVFSLFIPTYSSFFPIVLSLSFVVEFLTVFPVSLYYYRRALSSISEGVTRLARAGRMTCKVRRDYEIITDVSSRVSLETSNLEDLRFVPQNHYIRK